MTALDELLSESQALDFESESFSSYVDALPIALSYLRGFFSYPSKMSLQSSAAIDNGDSEATAIYLCGNSLGLMPKSTRELVNQELDIWSGRGVMGHFDHPLDRPWKDITDTVQKSMAQIVGAEPSEVAVMGSLTSNLHTLLSSFYSPRGRRTKILYEAKAFPSDEYAFTSQVRLHDLRPAEHLLALSPRPGEFTLRTEDILDKIDEYKDEIAVVMFSGVQYYSGQYFDIEAITAKGHEIGAIVGWDLAHAVGNLPVRLHDWNVDFACWCNYKYMNAGPGAIAGIFVHTRANLPETSPASASGFNYPNRLAGWWGHNAGTRFKMEPTFDPIPGAAGYQLSNPSVLNVVSLLASLQVFEMTTMTALRAKSVLLTGYLEKLLARPLTDKTRASYTIITPSAPEARGAQLSVLFQPENEGVMEYVMSVLLRHNIIADERQPDVIRLSPIPSYNTFSEVRLVAQIVREAVHTWRPNSSGAAVMQQTT